MWPTALIHVTFPRFIILRFRIKLSALLFVILAGRRLCHVRGDPQPEPSRAGHGQHHHVRPGAPPQEVQGQERLRLILHQRLTTTAQEQEAKEQHSSLTLLLPRAVLLLGIMVVHCETDTRRLCSVLF